MSIMRARTYTAAALGLVCLLLAGCASDELVGQGMDNQPPQVWLSSAPPEGTVSKYTLHLFWGGWDPDGEIAFYEYIITNNESGVFDPADTTSTPGDYKWKTVISNDSIFTFTADLVADSTAFADNELEPEEFRRSHTFFIRSVDEQGARAQKPAYRSFTSRTLSPIVNVLIPRRTLLNPASVPPITTFQWTAKDFVSNKDQVQDPDSVRWIVVPTKRFGDDWDATFDYIRTSPDAPEWSDWHYYQAPGDTGRFWTSKPMEFGNYLFAIQAMDEAGAVSPVFDLDFNLRRILVSTRATGPVLTVRNEFLGTVVTSSPNTPLAILDLPAGLPMQFEFEADATSYGGIVSGYRYGWDILDLNDDSLWEIDFTPFIGDVARSPLRTFFFGTHTFHIEVVDNSGFKSRVGVLLNIVQFNMQRNLLLVDDWRDGTTQNFGSTKGAIPSDGETDQFWRHVLSSAEGFNPAVDVFELRPGVPTVPIQVVADYQNIIWNAAASHNSESGAVIAEMVKFKDPDERNTGGKSTPNIPALFMQAGGHMLICGEQAMTMVINRFSFSEGPPVFPIIFRYELTGDQDGVYGESDIGVKGVGENSFAYNHCCLNVLDIAYIQNVFNVRRPPKQRVPPNTGCPVNLIRDHDLGGNGRTDGLRAAVPVDLSTGPGFPRLELRSEVAGDPTRFYHESKIGLNCDIYNPMYFNDLTACGPVAELVPARSCFQPIYTLECVNTASVIFGAPIAFWTSQFATRVPDVGGIAARTAVWGFQPVYFNPDQVKAAVEIIVHDEWQIPRVVTP